MTKIDSVEIASGVLAAKRLIQKIECIVKSSRDNEGGDFDITAIANLLESDEFTSDLRHRRGFALAMADALGSAVEVGNIDSTMLNPLDRLEAFDPASELGGPSSPTSATRT